MTEAEIVLRLKPEHFAGQPEPFGEDDHLALVVIRHFATQPSELVAKMQALLDAHENLAAYDIEQMAQLWRARRNVARLLLGWRDGDQPEPVVSDAVTKLTRDYVRAHRKGG